MGSVMHKAVFFPVVIGVWVLCSAVSAGQGSDPVDPGAGLLAANQAYTQGRFADAAHGYAALIDGGITNGDLYYNLGNAHMKRGEVGRAILCYRRAERYLPRDDDLQSNLAFALQQRRDVLSCDRWYTEVADFCFWYTGLSAFELMWVFLGVHAAFWLLLVVRQFRKHEAVTVLCALALFFTVLFGFSAGIKQYTAVFVPRGVVLAGEVRVRSGMSPGDTVLFALHAGTEFFWEEERPEGWVRIRLCDGKKGWVLDETVAKI